VLFSFSIYHQASAPLPCEQVAFPCEQSSFETLSVNHSSFLISLVYNEVNYLFGGENMAYLVDIGTFFGGLGLLLLSFGVFWFVDVYKKSKGSKQK